MRPVTQGGQSGIDFVQCWPSHFCASRIGHFFFEFRDVCWFRFLSWDSSISTSLVFLLFAGGVRISWKKWCWKGRNGSWNFIPCHLTSFKLLMLSFTFWWILGPKKPDPSGMLYVNSWIVLQISWIKHTKIEIVNKLRKKKNVDRRGKCGPTMSQCSRMLMKTSR